MARLLLKDNLNFMVLLYAFLRFDHLCELGMSQDPQFGSRVMFLKRPDDLTNLSQIKNLMPKNHIEKIY